MLPTPYARYELVSNTINTSYDQIDVRIVDGHNFKYLVRSLYVNARTITRKDNKSSYDVRMGNRNWFRIEKKILLPIYTTQ